jgi:putative hydrolase of the HAD superfamily
MLVSGATRRAILIDVGGVLCSDGLPAVAAVWSARLGVSERVLLAAIFGESDETVLVGRVSEPSWWRVVGTRLGIGPAPLAGLPADIAAAGSWDAQLLAVLRDLRGDARTARLGPPRCQARARAAHR